MLSATYSQFRSSYLAPASDAVRRTVVSRRAGPTVFQDLWGWPDFDQILTDESIQIIRKVGVADWALAGGLLLPSGFPTLRNPSPIAHRLLRRIIHNGGRFRFTDDCAIHWAVIVPETSICQPHWNGIAIGVVFSPVLFEERFRKNHLRFLEAEHHRQVQADRAIGAHPRPERARVAADLEGLQLLDLAMKIIPAMYSAAQSCGSRTIDLDHRVLARAAGCENYLPSTTSKTLFEAVSLLSTIRTQLLEIPKSGWSPTPRRRGAAVHRVRRLSDGAFRVQLDPLFLEFIGCELGDPAINQSASTELGSLRSK